MPLGTSFRALLGAGVAGPWDVIDSVELGSAAPSVSFQSIDSKYKLFRVTAYIIKDGTGANALLRVNNDSGSNYDSQFLTGNSTSVGATRTAGGTSSLVAQIAANAPATLSFVIGKQIAGVAAMGLVEGGVNPVGDITTRHTAFRWNNTADLINRIDLISSSGNFAAGTVVVLEGA